MHLARTSKYRSSTKKYNSYRHTNENMDALPIFVTICIASFSLVGTLAAIFDVMAYGAVGDGKQDDTQAFLKAWKDACSATGESPTLNIPVDKTFLLSPVNFKGPCYFSTIHVQVLGNVVAPNYLDAWEGCEKNSWIVFSAVNGLIVDGSGQIDGQGSFWWRQGHQTPTCGKQPTALHFNKCDNMNLSGLNHVNPPRNHIGINKCTNVTISNLNITAPKHSPNTDGIDIASSSQVQIHDLNIQTGDDCIAINNGCSYINITSVACGPGHGISIGSLGRGGTFATVEKVHVQNCKFTNTQNGCRIKTWPGGTGYARHISFENITLNEVQNPIIINQHYCIHMAAGDLGFQKTCPEQAKAVQVSNVTYKYVQGSSATKVAINLDCSTNVGCANITMEHINISGVEVCASCTKAQGTASHTLPQVPCLLSN